MHKWCRSISQEHRLAGPFPKSLIPSAHISPFGVIPKSHQPGKWRLIVNLSYPNGFSVNDSIPRELCSISYVTIDDAIQNIVELGLIGQGRHKKCIPINTSAPGRSPLACYGMGWYAVNRYLPPVWSEVSSEAV